MTCGGSRRAAAAAAPSPRTFPGSVWKVVTGEGAQVSAGDPLVVVESMKMELTVSAPISGKVTRVVCREGQSVSAGQTLMALAP